MHKFLLPLLGISCLLGMGECLPRIVGGGGSALRVFTFLPPLVTMLVTPVGPCLPALPVGGLLLCSPAATATGVALLLKGELLWLNFEEDAVVFCPMVALEREVELWPASLWWGDCTLLGFWWRGVLWVEELLCVLRLIFSSSSIVMTVLPSRTRLRVASDKTDLLKETLLPLVEGFILVGDITLEGVLRRWGWERDWPHGMESRCCWLGTSPTPSISITDVFDGATIYLLLLVEFLDTDIRGVVKDVILVSTFFGEGIPAMRFCRARLAASTIKAVSDFLITMCELNSSLTSPGSVLPMRESSSLFSLTSLTGLAPTREGVAEVSIGGRLMEEWSFFNGLFFVRLTLVDASVLTRGGREMAPGERGSWSGTRWCGWSSHGDSRIGRWTSL